MTETIRHALRQHKTAVIAVETGLSIATIEAIKSGRNQYPTTRTVEKLLAFLENQNVKNVDFPTG